MMGLLARARTGRSGARSPRASLLGASGLPAGRLLRSLLPRTMVMQRMRSLKVKKIVLQEEE